MTTSTEVLQATEQVIPPPQQPPTSVSTPKVVQGAPPKYGFEATGRRRDADKVAADTAAFLERLAPDAVLVELASDDRLAVEECVDAHVRNIYWYTRALQKERTLKWGVFAGTLVLLFAVPAAIFALSDNADSVVGQLGILVAALFGAQKGVAGWVDKRKFEGQFWAASADLKSALYKLEASLKGKPLFGEAVGGKQVLAPDVLVSLKAATTSARVVVETETRAYFVSYAVPTVDLSGSLTAEPFATLLQTFSSSKAAELKAAKTKAETYAAARVKAEGAIAGAQDTIARVTESLNKERTAFASLSAEEKTLASSRITSLNTELATVQTALRTAQAQLAVLEAERTAAKSPS